ncbi:hypothetical protein LBMAG53_04050 [Planctomycetota bacterium]|nr:hypothetical protein LBMAG53_04050 [Planctomycetota bacterium]
MADPLVVVGGGVAGCAAAVAAAEILGPQSVVLLCADHHLGGVAVQGEHRTLCGLAPIDAPVAELLEPDLTESWISPLTTGAPFRSGRVWLWPTAADAVQRGLALRLAQAGVVVRRGTAVVDVAWDQGRIAAVRTGSGEMPCQAVIDASGCAAIAQAAGLATAPGAQWGAYRSMLRLDLGHGLGARATALRRVLTAIAPQAAGNAAESATIPAVALTPIGEDLWQMSIDVAPGTPVAVAAELAERAAAALGGELYACARAVAERDSGRPIARLTVAELFSTRERGLAWAAWPREQHGPDGIQWEWPAADRHGVPEIATRPLGGPSNVWCVGRAMAVDAAAAAALRVTGTALALGTAVGRRAATGSA